MKENEIEAEGEDSEREADDKKKKKKTREMNRGEDAKVAGWRKVVQGGEKKLKLETCS